MRKSHIKIHEDATGGIYMVGVATRPVHSLEDVCKFLICSTSKTKIRKMQSILHVMIQSAYFII